MYIFLSDWFALVDIGEYLRKFAVLFCCVRKDVRSPNGTFERVVEGCRLSGPQSPVTDLRDAGEGLFPG